MVLFSLVAASNTTDFNQIHLELETLDYGQHRIKIGEQEHWITKKLKTTPQPKRQLQIMVIFWDG